MARHPPRVWCFAVALAVGLLVTATASARLRWGADAEGGAPYVYRDPKDPSRTLGFEVDLAAALAEALGEPIDFVQYEYSSLLGGLDRGDLDLAMNGLEVTADRARKVRFSLPYYTYRLELVARATDHRFDDLAGVASLGGTVGTLGDTAAERLLDERRVAKRVYDGQLEPYRDLALGRVDAVLLDRPIALAYAKDDAALRFVRGGRDPLPAGTYAIALRRRDEALGRRIDGALASLCASGELQRILARWDLWNEDQACAAKTTPAAATTPDLAGTTAEQWTLRRYLPLLLAGAVTTVQVSVGSMAFAMVLGLLLAAARLWGPGPVKVLAMAYVELLRGVPVLLLLFFLYYGLPTVGLSLPAMTAAILGFGLNYAAYEAEIYRAAILAVPAGQWEACFALGMGRTLAFRRIVLPQALRIALPAMTNDFVALFKDTSLVSVIAVVELTKQYQILAKSSLKYLEIGVATAALYLVISVPLGHLSRRLEARWSRGLAP